MPKGTSQIAPCEDIVDQTERGAPRVQLSLHVTAAEELDDMLTMGRGRPRGTSLAVVEQALRRGVRCGLRKTRAPRRHEVAAERVQWNFYLPDEDRTVGWTNHCYVLQFVCHGVGDDPATAWKEAVAAGRIPEHYASGPPTVAIKSEAEQVVDLAV